MRAERDSQHISGAETLCYEEEIPVLVQKFSEKALGHPKGKPEKVFITIEKLNEEPLRLKGPDVFTLKTRNLNEAWQCAREVLSKLGVSEKAFHTAEEVITSEETMRGATVVIATTGQRLEPDRQRGIRATRMGILPEASLQLEKELKKRGLNVQVVKDAIVLATKVINCPYIIAEFCVSDDPDYTTGYVASRRLGYVRIPHLKERGSHWGGRAFFVSEALQMDHLIDYLQSRPVIITTSGRFHDEMAPEVFLNLLDS